MASNGSIQETIYMRGSYTVVLEWATVQMIPETNSTKISWRMTLKAHDLGITMAGNRPYTVRFNGQTFGGYANCNISRGETKELATGIAIIPHNTDGTKSFAYSFELEITWAPVYIVTASGIDVLDPFNKQVTEATIISAPNFTDEDNPMITYSNPMGESISSLQACVAIDTPEGGSSIIIAYRDISKTGTNYTFNFTDSERTQLLALLQNSATYPVRFYVKSVIDGVTYHSFSTPKTLSIANARPVITLASALDTNSVTFNLTGDSNKIIRGANAVRCQFEATGQKNATIKELAVTCGAETKTGTNTVFNNVESGTFTFRVKDSRGLITTKTVYLPMIEYIKPTCNQTVVMVKESETETQADITITGKYFDDSFGAASNTLKLESRRKEEGGEWSEWADITILVSDISNNTYTATGNISGLDASGTYVFQSRIIDEIMTVESAKESFTLLPVFDWSKMDFNFNVPVTIQGGLVHDYVIETGTEEMGTNGIWYWSKWKSGRAECYGCRNYGNMGISTAWGGLYKSSTFGQDLPSGLFATTPEAMHIQVRDTGTGTTTSGCWISSHIGWAPDETTTGGFAVVSPVSGNASQVYISFNIVGRWK